MTPARILIVEDDRVVARDIQQQLTKIGHTVVGVTAIGERALPLAIESHAELVLMDIRLEGEMDGVDAAQQIRERCQIPVVFLTAYTDDHTVQRASFTEPFGYLLKPFEDSQLRTAVEMALYKHAAERKLRESERRYAATLSSIGDGVISTDRDARVTFMNPVAQILTGWPLEDAQGRSLSEVFRIVNEQTRQAIADPAAEVLRLGTTVELSNHTTLLARDGHEVPIYDCGAPIVNDHGKVTGAVLVFRDMSERRLTEEALRRSEAYLAEAQRVSHIGSWAYDVVRRRPQYWSAEMYRIARFDPSCGPPSVEQGSALHSPEDLARLMETIDRAIYDKSDFQTDTRLQFPDGAVKHLHVTGHPVLNASGEVVELVGTSMDVTEQRNAELALEKAFDTIRKSEAQLRTIIDTIPALAWCNLPDGSNEFLNRRWHDYTGLSPEEAHGWGWQVAFHPDDLRQFMERWMAILASGKPGEAEGRLRRFDGEYRWFLFRFEPLRDEQGAIVRWYGTNTDIEDLKRSESLLAGENRLLEMIAKGEPLVSILNAICLLVEELCRNSLCSVLVLDPITNRLWCKAAPNIPPNYTEMINGFVIGPNMGSCGTAAYLKEPVFVPDIATDPKWAHFKHGALESGLRACWSSPILSRDGIVLGTFATYYRDARNPTPEQLNLIEQVTHLTSIAIEHKRSEEALRRSEGYLADAQRLSLTGSFGWSVSSGEIFWSDESFRIFEYDKSVRPTLEMVIERVHPDDRALVRQTLERASREGSDWDLEHRLEMPDRSIKSVRIVARPIRDHSGNLEFVGALMDVTAANRAFEEIQFLKEKLYKENLALRDEVDRASMFEEIVGASPALQTVLSRVARVAPTDSTVLITGESGTGKELIARAVHKRSQRAGRAFVSVNCAALAPSLISSELFGHERGAFTGATQRRLGRFELADGGTIFLDEVGDLPPDTQVALLRVLQERELERVGGAQSIPVDVRVITATNRDLKAAVANGTFRLDLFYRLNVFPIEVPPLRERKDDVLMLLEYFVRRYASRTGKNILRIDKRTLELFQSYDWPGNIRELQNVIERSVILCTGEVFSVDEAWLSKESATSSYAALPPAPIGQNGADQERRIIESALAESRGRVAGPFGAAAKLRVPPSTLESRIKALQINKSRFKFT